jgi:hypothetical protein
MNSVRQGSKAGWLCMSSYVQKSDEDLLLLLLLKGLELLTKKFWFSQQILSISVGS